MQGGPASPSIQFPMDDRDLDDAELWAVIDSAAASASACSRKPLLALEHPAPRLSRTPSYHLQAPTEDQRRIPTDGEVVQEDRWAHRHPRKMARLAAPERNADHRMVVVRHPPRAPVAALPMPYSSPESGRVVVKEVVSPVLESPPPDYRQSEEKGSLGDNVLTGRVPSTSLFKQYQSAAFEILEKTDYTVISGNPFIKKSGWRKIAFFFNLSFEIRDRSIEFDENRNVQRAEFVVRASMQGGRFSDGWGSCERREKRFLKPNHDIPSTAETRAKNKACQDLLGIGEYRPGVINSHR